MVTAKRGAIPLAELRDIATQRSDLSGRASSLVRAQMAEAVKPAKTIEHKGRVTTSVPRSTLLDTLGLSDYGREEGFIPRSGAYGTSGIYAGRGTSEYTQGLVGMTRPEPDYPWWMDTWNAIPGPAQYGLAKGGGMFMKTLESLAIPLSAIAGVVENTALIGYRVFDPEGMKQNPAALAAYNDIAEMVNDPNKLKGLGMYLKDTLWDRKQSGSHDFMYGQGDIWNTFNIWQGDRGTDQEWEWWLNRGTALLGDLRMDPFFLTKTFGQIPKAISRGLRTGGYGPKLGKAFTVKKLEDVIRPLFKSEFRARGQDLPSRGGARAGEITETLLEDGKRVFVGEAVGPGNLGPTAASINAAAPVPSAARTLQVQNALRIAENGAKTALNPKTREAHRKIADRLRAELAGGAPQAPAHTASAARTLQVAEERVVPAVIVSGTKISDDVTERIYQFWDEFGTPFTVTWRGPEVLDELGRLRPTKAADLEIGGVGRGLGAKGTHVPNARPTHPSQTVRGAISPDTVVGTELFSAAGRRAAARVMEAELAGSASTAAAQVSERMAARTGTAAGDAAAHAQVWQEAIMNRMSDEDFILKVAQELNKDFKGVKQLVVREDGRTFINFGAKFGRHRKVAETLGNRVLKVEIPKDAAQDIGKIADYMMIGSREGLLKMTNEQYKFVARAMHEAGMDKNFFLGERTLLNGVVRQAEPEFLSAIKRGVSTGAVTATEAANAGLKIGFAVPFTGSLARRAVLNPVRKRLYKKAEGFMALQDPIPMLAWSASNKWMGRPLVAANNAARKAFVGRGQRYGSAGGRLAKQKRIVRKSNDPWEVLDAKTFLHAAAMGSQVSRSGQQQLSRMFNEIKDMVQVHPRLARDHPDGGPVLMRAVWGEEDAVQIVKEAIGDDLFEDFKRLLPDMADELEKKAGMKFIGRANNYGPRQITPEARDHLVQARPGSVLRRHRRKPYDPSGPEMARNYIDQDEYAALIKKFIKDGMEPEAAAEYVAKIHSDEVFGVKLHAVNSIMDDGLKAPSVESQIAKIMSDMDIGYGLFVDNWYEVMPNYIGGMAKRAGEVRTEFLLSQRYSLFKDRMSVMAQVPSQKIMGKWVLVMRTQLNLKHASARVMETLDNIINAEKAELKQLEVQLARRNAVLDLAEETYEKAVKGFDETAEVVASAEAKAMEVRAEVDALQVRIAEITNDMKAGDIKNATRLENERVKLSERLATLKADPSVPKYYLESLRSSTMGQLEMEHRIHGVFSNIETFEAFEKLFRKWDPATPLSKAALFDFVVANKDQPGFVGNLDIIPDVKQFVLRLGKEGVENEYKQDKVLKMLKGANAMLDDLDSTPLGSWLGVETSAVQQTGTLSGLRLQQYSQMYKTIKKHTDKSTAILQEWVAWHPAVWKGKIPSPANVEESRIALEKFSGNALKNGQTFGDAMAEVGADSALRQHLYTYYGVHNDLNMMNMTNFGTIDNVVNQMETAIRLRYHEIEKALAEFRPITIQVRVGPGEHGIRTLGIEEYAKYQRLKEAALQSPYSARVPVAPARYTVDDILRDGTKVAANDSGQHGVVGGTHPGGKFLVNTPTGPKEFYVKQYGTDARALAALQREADDVAEFIEKGLFHEVGDLSEGMDYRAHLEPMLERYRAGDGPQAFVHDHLISADVRDQAISHLEILEAQIGKQAFHGKRRAEGEVLANALYREMGGDVATAPVSYASYSEQTKSWWVVSDWMDGLMPVGLPGQAHEIAQTQRMYMAGGGLPRLVTLEQATALGPDAASNIRPIYDMLGDNFLTDVLLANWSVVGDDFEKIALSQSGRLVRVDNGGAFRYHGRGAPKGGPEGTWDYRVVEEIDGFLNPQQHRTYGMMAGMWGAGVDNGGGITSALGSQFTQLDEVRKSYGGWQGFVRRNLPDLQSSGEKEYVSFLEDRFEAIANKLGESYNTGMELAAEALTARGVPTHEIERALNHFGPTQALSMKQGFRPWLSPDLSSQALNTFSLEQARGALFGKHAESGLTGTKKAKQAKVWKEGVLEEAQSWMDGTWGQAQQWRDRAAKTHYLETPGDVEPELYMMLQDENIIAGMYRGDPVYGDLRPLAHHPYARTEDAWKGHRFDPDTGEFLEAWKPTRPGEKEPSYGVILVDGDGEFILRMPSAPKSGGTHPEGTWNFPRSTAKVWEEEGMMMAESPADAAIRAAKEQMGLDVYLMDAMPGRSLKDAKGTVQPVRATEGGAAYVEADQDVFFYIAQVGDQRPGAGNAKITTIGERVSHTTPTTSDPETWTSMMTLFHRSNGSYMVDPAGVNVGGSPAAWPDSWGLNFNPGAITNRHVRQADVMYAANINVGMAGESVRTYGIPTHLNARAVATARSQGIHAGQDALDEGLAAFTREMAGPNKDKPYYRLSEHNLVADGDMSVDMFGRVHDSDPQLYEDLRIYFKKFYRSTVERTGDPMWGVNRDLAEGVSNLSVKMDLLDDLGKYNIPTLDAMDYQTKALFVAHLENSGRMNRPARWPVDGVLSMGDDADVMEGVVVDFLARIDEKLNPIDAWAFKAELLSKRGLFPYDLQQARRQLAYTAMGDWPTGQTGRLGGVGRQPVLGRGEVLIPESPAAATERISRIPEQRGWRSVRQEGPESIGGSMRYDRFMEVYRKSMMRDGYTTAAWLNPEQFTLGKTVISDPKIGAFNAILLDPLAVSVTPRTVSRTMPDVLGKARVGVEDAGLLDVNQFLTDYARMTDEQLLGSSIGRGKVNPTDPIETLYEKRVQAAFDLDGEGGAMQQLKAAQARLEDAQKVKEEARLAKAAAKSETRAAKATKFRGGEPSKAAITKRALAILNQENLAPSAGRPAGRPDLKTESLRNAFAGSDKQLRAQARADLIQKPIGAEGVSKVKELETLISQAGKRVEAAETANAILQKLGTVDKFGRSVPLENLSTELRNLKVSVGALMDADAQYINLALKELDRGAEAAKWLRQVGEFGDDEVWFPLKKGFMRERYMDFSFEAGFKPFGVSSQGPAEMVDALTAVTKWRGGGGAWGRFFRYYDKVHNLVKGYLIMKPGFHMRNYFSAVFMNHLAGVEVQSYRQFQNAYWNYQHDRALELGLKNRASHLENSLKKRLIFKKATADDVAIIRQMDEAGILGGAQGQIGVEQVMAGGPAGNTKLKRALQAINPFSSRNAPLRLSKNAGMGVETYVRGVMGFDSIKRGNGVDVAFDRIMHFHFDYSDLSDFEAGVIKRLVPFYTWTRKNLPLMIEQIGTNPAAFNQYNILKKNIEGDEPITEMVPPWMIRQGGIQLPFKYEGENMWILPDLPFKTPLEMLDPILALDSSSPSERITAALSTLSTQLTPLVKGPIEWGVERNMWKGYNFTGKYVQVPTVYTKVPMLMPMLNVAQVAEKNNAGLWMMRDKDMHVMTMMLPVLSDMRRLFPTEEPYQQRTLSSWMSWWAGLGLRTNTRDEQERAYRAYLQEIEDERAKGYKRKAAGLNP